MTSKTRAGTVNVSSSFNQCSSAAPDTVTVTDEPLAALSRQARYVGHRWCLLGVAGLHGRRRSAREDPQVSYSSIPAFSPNWWPTPRHRPPGPFILSLLDLEVCPVDGT
jgi:hypothetical protein